MYIVYLSYCYVLIPYIKYIFFIQCRTPLFYYAQMK